MAETNKTIIGRIALNGSNQFQQNVPICDQANIQATVSAIFDPSLNLYNEFVNALVNQFGDIIVHSRRWENPLEALRGPNLEFGTRVEEVGAQLIKAKCYDPEAKDLLDVNEPELLTAFHDLNRKDKYPITINPYELRRAVLSGEYGLNEYMNQIMTLPINSDRVDTYNITMQLLADYEQNWGFRRVNVPDLASVNATEADAKRALKTMRTLARKMRFYSTEYNAYGMPTFSNPGDLMLLATSEYYEAVNVDALAALFNVDRAEIPYRVAIVDEIPIDGAEAVLMDREFIIQRDFVYTTRNFDNPSTLMTNHWLHHWSMNSVSPMLNAVLLGDFQTTGITTVTVNVTGGTIALPTGVTSVAPGEDVELVGTVAGTVSPDDEGVEVPQAIRYYIKGAIDSDKEAVDLAPHTYVTPDGHLYVDPDEQAAEITVSGIVVWLNPDASTPQTQKTTNDVIVEIG